jgi:hypothetical protein
MPTYGWRNLRTSFSAFQTASKTRPAGRCCGLCAAQSPAEITELPERTPEQCSGQVKRIGAPSRIRTYDTRFRKPLLYPLSYGG